MVLAAPGPLLTPLITFFSSPPKTPNRSQSAKTPICNGDPTPPPPGSRAAAGGGGAREAWAGQHRRPTTTPATARLPPVGPGPSAYDRTSAPAPTNQTTWAQTGGGPADDG